MQMQSHTKERIYLLIMVFCLLMCAVLLISVFCDLPLATVGPYYENHVPVMRITPDVTTVPPPAQLAGSDGFRVTAEELEGQMKSFIPQSFPTTQIDLDIQQRGAFVAALTVFKSDLKAYLEDCGVSMGIKQRFAISMLPDSLELEVSLLCASTGKNMVQLDIEQLSVNGKSVDTDFLPSNMFDVLGGAINASLAYTGYDYSDVVFEDGAVQLR